MGNDKKIGSKFLRKWPAKQPDTVPEVNEEEVSVLNASKHVSNSLKGLKKHVSRGGTVQIER